MSENTIQLENLLKAVEVSEKFYEVKASDGKTYLCEKLFSWGSSVEGSNAYHSSIPDQEKEKIKKVFTHKLSKQNIEPDIIHEIDSTTGKSNFLQDNSTLSTYRLDAYRIEKELP